MKPLAHNQKIFYRPTFIRRFGYRGLKAHSGRSLSPIKTKTRDEYHTSRTFLCFHANRRCGPVKFNLIFFLTEDKGREMLLIHTASTVRQLSIDHRCQ